MALSVDIEKNLGNFRLKVKFDAQDGVLALLGASGCGKSMTLKCIAGIEKPDKGKIVLDGITLFDSDARINLSPQKRRVGYLFQQYALFPNMTVAQNIAAGIRDGKRDRTSVKEIMHAMRLDGLDLKKPRQLSGGQQQRVALARILVNKPNALLLDEPFSALDSHLRFQMEREVRTVIHDFGKSVLLVSHDRDEVYRMSDQIAIMGNGHIEKSGRREEVFSAPKTKNGAILTGCKNISPIKKLTEHSAYALDWGIELTLDNEVSSFDNIGIRMHDVHPGDGENSVLCRVEEVIENPFSYTIMLRPENSQASTCFGWETDKSEWKKYECEHITVNLPSKSLLLLKE